MARLKSSIGEDWPVKLVRQVSASISEVWEIMLFFCGSRSKAIFRPLEVRSADSGFRDGV